MLVMFLTILVFVIFLALLGEKITNCCKCLSFRPEEIETNDSSATYFQTLSKVEKTISYREEANNRVKLGLKLLNDW